MRQIQLLKQSIVPTLKKYGIERAGIFGSYGRGEQKKSSDVDILIEYNGSLLKLVRIERELQLALKKKVDLLTYKGVSPYLKKEILAEERKIL